MIMIIAAAIAIDAEHMPLHGHPDPHPHPHLTPTLTPTRRAGPKAVRDAAGQCHWVIGREPTGQACSGIPCNKLIQKP